MRIPLNDWEKQLILKYCGIVSNDLRSQLGNRRRKTIDIERADLEDVVGWLSRECNHAKNRQVAFELNDLCEMLESYL